MKPKPIGPVTKIIGLPGRGACGREVDRADVGLAWRRRPSRRGAPELLEELAAEIDRLADRLDNEGS